MTRTRTAQVTTDQATPEVPTDTDATQAEATPRDYQAEYAVADKSGKAAIRTTLRHAMEQAINDLDLPAAQAAKRTLDSLSSVTTKQAVAPDYVTLAAERLVTLRHAIEALTSGQAVFPEGVEVDMTEVFTLADEQFNLGDASDLFRADAINELCTVKVRTSVTRRDLGAHVAAVAAMHPSGTFLTIAQVASTRTEVYGDERPSDGAISARLFAEGGCTIPGVVPVAKSDQHPKGLRVA